MKSLSDLTVEQCQVIDQLADQFENAFRAGQRPSIENVLVANSSVRPHLLNELLAIEIELRRLAGEQPTMEAYNHRFPDDQSLVEAVFCHGLDLESTADPSWDNKVEEEEPKPERLDRYIIQRQLGRGGFGVVYLAHDEQLDRPVAVKVPHAKLISVPEDVQTYLAEARTVASLDHPAIVPVHDVGSTEKCPCYVVSKYIPGIDLATKLKQKRLAYWEAAELVAIVADALHYAHKQGLVHRDVKPGNILIDNDGKPYVVDFGLALREEDFGKGLKYAGTPAYMSPEQVRGEGHRVDGRSDIFSLGVVFYELLAGRRPFRGDTRAELFEQVTSYEAKPLRQYDEKLPKELERICHKAMEKRASERFSSAHDMAEELRLFLAEQKMIQSGVTPGYATSVNTAAFSTNGSNNPIGSSAGSSVSANLGTSGAQPIKIVPKGLRSFDANDADFFLELLPGPRDRNGLPDSLRFWKTLIEETDPDNTFSVGLIYGPSGCGKSSLVKAGLLPRLSEQLIPVYVESTPGETEARLLHGLRKHCPALEDNMKLDATLAALRRGQGIPVGKKVLIVLDQFEQWLHVNGDEEKNDLVRALRQCDGGRVQCIVMVRDDFWMAATRFMRNLEIRLVEARNSAAVDLFPIRHAEKVLAAFGRAFGALPDNLSDMNKEQKYFLKQSVAGLTEEGKVICVRLALFAEMMKGNAWTPATLKQVGGTNGVGVTFLEETFSGSTSPPAHRYHQKAARAILKALLPDSGIDIKGYMRSYAELLETSGYGNRPKDFDEIIRILDSEIRLITPTDSEGECPENESVTQGAARQKFFQLTHDYLVHSLRDWLTRKQKETYKGRVELKLFDNSVTWNSNPENRYLPSWWENLNIRLFTDSKKWTEPQRTMMIKAGKVHGLRSAISLAGLVAMVFIIVGVRTQVAKQQAATRIEGLVGRLVSAEPMQLPQIVKELDVTPILAASFLAPLIESDASTIDQKRSKLHARLAMVARDKSLVAPLLETLLTGKVTYVLPIREQLRPYSGELTGKLRDILRDETIEANRRFHAALALAEYVPVSESTSWTEKDLTFVTEQLTSSNAEFQPLLRQALRPICEKLLPALERIFGNAKQTDAQRLSAANAFADYCENDVTRISRLLALATPEQFAVLYPLVAVSPASNAIDDLSKIAAKLPPHELGSVERIEFGQQRANAAVTLLRLGELEKALSVFEWTDDPEAMTQFVFRCRPRGVSVGSLLDCLQLVSVAPKNRYPSHTRYALLLALGEFTIQEVPEALRDSLINQLSDWYAKDPSSGVHGASGWLLRQWGQHEVVKQVDQTPVPYSSGREWFTLSIKIAPTIPQKTKGDDKGEMPSDPLQSKTLYYTFIVFPGGEYTIGSTPDEPKRTELEAPHRFIVSRPFGMLDREITLEELIAFNRNYAMLLDVSFDRQSPKGGASAGSQMNWYESVEFCRWLSLQSGLTEADQSYADPRSLATSLYPREPTPAYNWAPRNWPLQLGRRGFRLPSESEWELACRAGSRTTYGFGSDVALLGRFGWSLENSGNQVHSPKELRPNQRGLFDLHGNLCEWCHDWNGAYSNQVETDPLGAKLGSNRIHRGGCWERVAEFNRSSVRTMFNPPFRHYWNGFRVAMSLTDTSVVGTLPENDLNQNRSNDVQAPK